MSLWTDLIGAGGTYKVGQDLIATGDEAQADMAALSDKLQGDTSFQGFGVTSELGNISVGADGSVSGLLGGGDVGMGDYTTGQGTLGSAADMAGQGAYNKLTPEAITRLRNATLGSGKLQEGAYGASEQFRNNSLQSTVDREQDIYNRMMNTQQPGLDRARSAMEARAFAQGRSGIGGSQYGGSGEQFAQSRAEAEARNSAMLGAMGQAQAEQMQQGQLAQMYGNQGLGASQLRGQFANQLNQWGLGNAQLQQGAAGLLGNIGAQQAGLGLQGYQSSFLPAEMQLQQGAFGATLADMAQTGQLTGANLGAQLGLGGIQTDVNAQKAASELYGNMFGAIMEGGGASWGDDIKNLFNL
jgi:hypothetical protein